MSRQLIGAAVFVLLAVGAAVYWNTKPTPSNEPAKIEFSAAESEDLQITHLVTIRDRAYTVEVAATAEEQATGLSNRASMPNTSGMLFPFQPERVVTFWMKDMQFPIDIIWISHGKVIGVTKNLPVPPKGQKPQDLPTYSPPEAVDYVLELNVGQGALFSVGDEVTITQIHAA